MELKKEALITAMKNSISDVLETMFFLPLDFSDSLAMEELWDLGKDNILSAKLDFGGPFDGYCVLYIPEKLAESITADFMGKKEKSICEDQVVGTVKEITNMIVGNIFSFFDPQAVFNLEIPELVSFSEYPVNLFGSENEIFLAIDTPENHLAFQMTIIFKD
jgi:CheY-specific phosphatase CheX